MARSPTGDIESGERPARNSMSLGLDSHPSFIDPNARAGNQIVGGEGTTNETEHGLDKDVIGEVRIATSDAARLADEERTAPRRESSQAGFDVSGDV
ncbi:unnamed protein product [Peniophora sp. CBMAI 1063]|nr:unnamed protein product [Peniophora sp. CBMAI 1063]